MEAPAGQWGSFEILCVTQWVNEAKRDAHPKYQCLQYIEPSATALAARNRSIRVEDIATGTVHKRFENRHFARV